MHTRVRRRLRARLIHYWDQHPLHRLRLDALRAGLRAAVGVGLAAAVLRFAPMVVVAALVLIAGIAAARHVYGGLLEQRRQEDQDEWTALRLRAAVRHRRRTVRDMLDAHVPPELHAELVHQVAVYRALEDECERLGGAAAVEVDGILLRPAMPAGESAPRLPRPR
jgi:hypothetical protein